MTGQEVYQVRLSHGPVDATVRLPGSKSITNRALPIAALATGDTWIRGALFSDDSRFFAGALGRLGYEVQLDEAAASMRVSGRGPAPMLHPDGVDLHIGNSGTAARFLTPFVALGRGVYRIDGVERMRERPVGDLLAALRQAGVDAVDELGTGCPPVLVRASGVAGGEVVVRGADSSQFVSALLLVAPYAARDMRIVVDGDLVSRPYVDMTVAMMRQFGAEVEERQPGLFQVARTMYRGREYTVEPDASGASYFFAAAAATGGCATVEGLGANALQGDAQFVEVLARMGCRVTVNADRITVCGPSDGLWGVDVDLHDMSDTVPTLAAIAPLARGPVTIRNVANVRVKETDRLRACANELRKFGVTVGEFPDGLRIEPCAALRTGVIVETYEDHRIAMAFSVLGSCVAGTQIADPGCVAKTFPDFFSRFEAMQRGGLEA